MDKVETKPRILVVEDEQALGTLLTYNLEAEGYRVRSTENGEEVAGLVADERPDLILLDIMLPHLSGLDACQLLKKDPRTSRIPVIFLSAKSKISDITSGLQLGADDYISKPFDYKELLARVQARLRATASRGNGGEPLIAGDLVIDPASRSVKYRNRNIDLTLTEFDILRRLASSAGETVTRKDIIEAVQIGRAHV